MKVDRGSVGKAPFILNVRILYGDEWSASCFSRGKSTRYLLSRWMDNHRSWFGRGGNKNSCLRMGSGPRSSYP